MLAKAINRIVLLGGGTCSRTSVYLDPKEDSTMARSRKFLTAGAAGVAAVALIAASTSVTGAYFSEAKVGGINGNIGAVHVSASETFFTWADMMPGEQKTATVEFTNKGTGPQDFYLVFQNKTALSALNSLGEYGEAHISVNGIEKFGSKNLNDGYACGTLATSPAVETLCAVPEQMLLASGVAKNQGGAVTFQFGYTGKLKTPLSYGAPFNHYPVMKADGTNDQKIVIAADGTGFGLPYEIVATQVGHAPTN